MGTGHRRLGVLTVGQAPRDDVTPTLRAVLGESVLLRESGALDGLTEEGLADLAPRDSETPLETRLSGGAPRGRRLRRPAGAVRDDRGRARPQGRPVTSIACSGGSVMTGDDDPVTH